jgi:hypothetical protein
MILTTASTIASSFLADTVVVDNGRTMGIIAWLAYRPI